jgi:hypothetical protein
VQESSNAESVGQFQPRVCFETLGAKMSRRLFATLQGLRGFAVNKRQRNSFRVAPSGNGGAFSQGCQSTTLGWNWRTLSALFISDESSQEWGSIRLFLQSERE